MLSYLLRRLLHALILIWSVLTLTFLLVHLSPGNPVDRYLSPRTPPETIALIRHNFGFDQPLPVQYLKWMRQWFRGDFGYSLSHHRPVLMVLADALPATLQLTLPALLFTFIFGILLGTIAARHRSRWPDRLLTNGTLAAYCAPSYWLGLMLILIFSVKLGWLPNSHASSLFAEEMKAWAYFKDRLAHLALPVLTLTLPGTAATARYVRENLVNILESNFIRLARAKGLPSWQVLTRHALPHVLLSLISLFGLSFPVLFGGAFLTETIFAWPGMGRVTFEAIFARDYPVVLAATGLSAIMVIVGNLMADALYQFADPRIKSIA